MEATASVPEGVAPEDEHALLRCPGPKKPWLLRSHGGGPNGTRWLISQQYGMVDSMESIGKSTEVFNTEMVDLDDDLAYCLKPPDDTWYDSYDVDLA